MREGIFVWVSRGKPVTHGGQMEEKKDKKDNPIAAKGDPKTVKSVKKNTQEKAEVASAIEKHPSQEQKGGKTKIKSAVSEKAQIIKKPVFLTKIQFDIEKISLSLSNLNIFGLGYVLSGKIQRWLFWLAGGIILLTAGYFLNASNNPGLWAALFIAYFIAMTLDLFLLLQRDKPQTPDLLKKSKYILPAIALLINAIFYGGFFAFRSSGSNLYQQGLDAFYGGDFSSAVGSWCPLTAYYPLSLNKEVVDVQEALNEASVLQNIRNLVKDGHYQAALDSIALFNSIYSKTAHKNFIKQTGMDAYLGLSTQQLAQEKFEDSLDSLQTAAIVYPDTVFENPDMMDEAYNNLFLGWAQHLKNQEEYQSALPKYEFVLTSFPDSPGSKDAYEGAAQSYYGLSDQLSKENLREEAALALEVVLNKYADSEAVESVETALPGAYLAWGKELRDDKHYLAAMEKFEDVGKLSQADAGTKREAKAEIEKTIPMLARDSGEDGTMVLAAAKEIACDRKIPDDKTVGLYAEEPGKFLACDSLRDSSKEWLGDLTASSPGEFLYTIFTEYDEDRVQSCPYTGNRTLYRIRLLTVVEVKSVLTGETIAEKLFYGSLPDSCPIIHSFYGMTDEMYGNYPESEPIVEWLEGIVE